jgi:tRNA(His) 5'-end guanylyltransferase
MKDELGERMKSQYEDRTRFSIPRRTYAIIRLDGKAFHTYTKGLNKPFDNGLIEDMDSAVKAIMPQIQGADFAYTQSDEISILVTDFETPQTSAWFDGNIQKMVSVSASLITAEFNRFRARRWRKDHNNMKASEFLSKHGMDDEATENFDYDNVGGKFKTAFFDSRVFTIPDRTEVMNYFIWRNQDCSRNSVSMLAQSLFSHKELQGKSTATMINMIAGHVNGAYSWDDLNQDLRFGRLVVKEKYVTVPNEFVLGPNTPDVPLLDRTRWTVMPAWRFTENNYKLLDMIPKYE